MKYIILLFILFLRVPTSSQTVVSGYSLYEPKLNLPKKLFKGNDGYKFKWQQYIAPAAFAFTAGAFQGTNEAIMHHYSGFKNRFPNANDDFWDPRKSWKNKWRLDESGDIIYDDKGNPVERFWLSSTAFVPFTDGYHLTDSGNYLFLQATYSFTPQHQGKPIGVQVSEIIGIWLFRKAGFHTTYSWAFKTK